MMRRLTIALVLAVAALGATYSISLTGRGSIQGHGSLGGFLGRFNTLTTSLATFDPSGISGMKCVDSTGAVVGAPPCGSNLLLSGYQGGDMIGGTAIYPPWTISSTLGSSWTVMNSVIIWFTGGTFSTAANWGAHDMNGDVAGCPDTSTTGWATACPGGYNSGIVVGTHYYLVPGADNRNAMYAMVNLPSGMGSATYSYVSSNAVISQKIVGAATGFYDSVRGFVHYVPSVDTFWVRHAVSGDSGGTLSASNWVSLDITTCPGFAPSSFLGSAWDGAKYAYGIPNTGNPASSVMIRFDASQTFGCGAFTEFDLSKLGTVGYALPSGGGTIGNLKGLAGAVIGLQGTTTSGTAWLYFVPWETYKSGFSTAQTLGYTAARVICGTWSGGTFTPADITSSSATWEVVDLAPMISGNPQFSTNGWNTSPGASFASGAHAGQPTVSAWQLGWWNATTGRVIFNASDGLFDLEFDPNKTMSDPTGIYVGEASSSYLGPNNFGGPASLGAAGNTVIYPSTPTLGGGFRMVQISGL